MRIALECKKMKRTGIFPAILGGGVLAALVPILNMAVRSENYVDLPGHPVEILLGANWQMMGMINLLMIIVGSCMIYHVEYVDNGIQKMRTLPVREERMFFDKLAVLVGMCIVMLLAEMVSLGGCVSYWFSNTDGMYAELIENLGYTVILILPGVLTALLISSVCRNMWTSLGIGVICVAAAIILPTRYFVLAIFPFSLPFQYVNGTDSDRVISFIIAALAEILACVMIQVIMKRRLQA